MDRETVAERVFQEGPLERLFQGSAMARILDFLAVFREWDYSKTDIAKNAGVSFRTVLRLLPVLEAYGIVKMTRRVGQAEMYRFNLDAPIAAHIRNLEHAIATKDVEKLAKGPRQVLKRRVPVLQPTEIERKTLVMAE